MTPNPNPSPELMPCPFCGNDGNGPLEHALHIIHSELRWRPVYDSYSVQCDRCTATMGYSDSEEEAIAAWNTRALSQTLPAPPPSTDVQSAATGFHEQDVSLKVALPAPGEVKRPISMKAWAGGDSAPDDWDGGPVKARNGKTVYTPAYWQHRPEPEWSGQWDIVAYTPTLATVAAANDEGVAEAIGQAARTVEAHAAECEREAERRVAGCPRQMWRKAAKELVVAAAAIRLLSQGGGK